MNKNCKNNIEKRFIFHEILSLSDWKTFSTISNELSKKGICINRRVFTKMIERNNKAFINNKVSDYIAHSQKGYKRTINYDEIIDSINDNDKRAYSMLKKSSDTKKYLENRDTDSLL